MSNNKRNMKWLLGRMLIEIWVIYEWIVSLIPGILGIFVRKLMIAPFLSYSGKRASIMWTVKIPELVHIWKPWNVVVGQNVRFGKYSQINAEGRIMIGNNVMMGPYVMLTTVTHSFEQNEISMNRQKSTVDTIEIGDDVWLGGHVSILPGVKIKDGIVVGAGAVVSEPLNEPFSVYVGVPARLKFRR